MQFPSAYFLYPPFFLQPRATVVLYFHALIEVNSEEAKEGTINSLKVQRPGCSSNLPLDKEPK